MILNNIKLINYRKFRDEFIEFPKGMFGIIGKNGAGKSTIFEAVGWVLYGNIMSRSGKEEIKSQNASEEEICRVELEFSFTGHNYKIMRELRGKSALSKASVFVDGSIGPEAVRDSEVNKYVEKLLGMDYVTFMRSVYAKQKDLGSLSVLPTGERQKIIRRMLNIDRIDFAVDSIRADKRDKQEFVKGIRFKLEDIKELKQRKENVARDISRIRELIDKLASKKVNLEKEKASAFNSRENQEVLYKKHNEITNSISRLSSRLDELMKRSKELSQEKENLKKAKQSLLVLEPKENLYEEKKNEKELMDELRLKHSRKINLEKIVKEEQGDIGARNIKIDEIQGKLFPLRGTDEEYRQAEQELRVLQKIEQSLTTDVKKVIAEESVCKAKIKELEEKKRDISKLGPQSKCPVCLRELGKAHPDILQHFEEELSNLKSKYQEIKKAKDKITEEEKEIKNKKVILEKAKEVLTKNLSYKSKYEGELKSEKQEILKVKSKLVKEESELKSLAHVKFSETEYKRLKSELEHLSKIRDGIISLRKEVSRLPRVSDEMRTKREAATDIEKTLKMHKTSLDELKFDESEYEKVKKQYEEIADKLSKSEISLKREEGNLKVKEMDLKTIKDKISEQKEYMAKINATKVDIQYLERLESLMLDFRNELINRIRPLLVARASYLFKELTDDRYALLELDEDYNIYLVDGSQKFGLKRFSGGEEDLANLCLRIAMSQVIAERSRAEINFMALDEVFGSQDEERRWNILNAFNKLTNQFVQIMLITHIETIKERLPYVLRVEENIHKESHLEFER